jgi:hypothetical protein
MADGKSEYFTVCLDLEMTRVMFVKQNNNQISGLFVPSKPWEQRTEFC